MNHSIRKEIKKIGGNGSDDIESSRGGKDWIQTTVNPFLWQSYDVKQEKF